MFWGSVNHVMRIRTCRIWIAHIALTPKAPTPKVSLGQPAVDDVRGKDVNTLQNCDDKEVGAQPEARILDVPGEEEEQEEVVRSESESGDSRVSLARSDGTASHTHGQRVDKHKQQIDMLGGWRKKHRNC